MNTHSIDIGQHIRTSLNFGYTGKAQDAVTGLMDYGFRDYAPRTARFTTVDPIRDGTNWYAYVGNDPVNKVNRWGVEAAPGDGKPTKPKNPQPASPQGKGGPKTPNPSSPVGNGTPKGRPPQSGPGIGPVTPDPLAPHSPDNPNGIGPTIPDQNPEPEPGISIDGIGVEIVTEDGPIIDIELGGEPYGDDDGYGVEDISVDVTIELPDFEVTIGVEGGSINVEDELFDDEPGSVSGSGPDTAEITLTVPLN